jgi:phage tail sheath protein FI
LNNVHVRDLLITVEEGVEDILSRYIFEFNDATTRLEIKSIVDTFLDGVRSAGGIYNFFTQMDDTNNPPEIIDQNKAIIDIAVEPARGIQIAISRITVTKTGGANASAFQFV